MRKLQSLIKWLRKSYGDVKYAAVKESGSRTGMKHLHLVICGPTWVPYAVLSQAWSSRCGAWAVDIQRVSSSRVAGYISKYLGKLSSGWRKIVTFSANWARRPRKPILDVQWFGSEPESRKWALVTSTGILVEYMGPECQCFGGDHAIHISRAGPTASYRPTAAQAGERA